MFEGTRLSNKNLSQYVSSTEYHPIIINGVPNLLQNNYGKDNDCTITSITALIKYLQPNREIQAIYNEVEKIAKRHGYTGFYGTPSLMISCVFKKTLKYFQTGLRSKTKILKNIGFTFEDIQAQINNHNPVLLNLWEDGRNYYKNHSVLIVGYFIVNGYKLLIVYDNWNLGISYIDYNKLSIISSINTLG